MDTELLVVVIFVLVAAHLLTKLSTELFPWTEESRLANLLKGSLRLEALLRATSKQVQGMPFLIKVLKFLSKVVNVCQHKESMIFEQPPSRLNPGPYF